MTTKQYQFVPGQRWISESEPELGLAIVLSAENRRMMYCPKGFAHGFVTLEENTEAFYLVSDPYAPELERGIRFNDPEFNIEWPLQPLEISDKDKNWPDFDPEWHGIDTFKGL